ncbi:hypothetical protein [Orenia marismortui]|uniref:hypothetical protein n=1 Tax=Orenia marismortui TaxID=46469 RepID=UPI00036D0BA2|nr:hypothetical protein [Orenia marismortui]
MKKCPYCNNIIRLTEAVLEKKECPYCHEKLKNLHDLEDVSEEQSNIEAPNLVKDKTFITYAFHELIYWILVIAITLIGLNYEGVLGKILIILVGNIVARISYEYSILFFSLHEQTVILNKQTEVTNELLKEIVDKDN